MKLFKITYEDRKTKVTQVSLERHTNRAELVSGIKRTMKTVYNHPLRLKSIKEIK